MINRNEILNISGLRYYINIQQLSLMQKKRGWQILVMLLLINSIIGRKELLNSNDAASTDIFHPIQKSNNPHNIIHNEQNTHQSTQPSGAESGESENQQQGHHHLTPSDGEFWEMVALALFLTVCGAFCSGMGVGLLSISKLQLNMMKENSDPFQKKKAQKILSIVNDHHLFLVTLLIANAMSLQSLPLVVHSLMPDWAAILTSTIMVLIAAQIIPQAFCTGVHKITIAYYASPIIYYMIRIFYVLSKPTALLLDYLVGAEHDQKIQHKDFSTFLNQDQFLNKTQKLLLTSTLDLRGDKVNKKMIPVDQFYMIEEHSLIDDKVVKEIIKRDYSYILVYRQTRNNIVGTIKIKEFALKYLNSDKSEMRACDVMRLTNEKMLTVYADTNLLQMLMLFQAKSTRFALVVSDLLKTDIQKPSIMYSQNQMIYNKSGAQITGVIFLYHIFNQMAQIGVKKIHVEEVLVKERAPNDDIEMDNIRTNLLH